MPRSPNKAAANGNRVIGMTGAILMELETALMIGEEIIDLEKGITGPILKEDAALHLVAQENICEALDKALLRALLDQQKLNEVRRKWFDTKLDTLPPTP